MEFSAGCFCFQRLLSKEKRETTLLLGLQKGAWIWCGTVGVQPMPSLSRELISGVTILCSAGGRGEHAIRLLGLLLAC